MVDRPRMTRDGLCKGGCEALRPVAGGCTLHSLEINGEGKSMGQLPNPVSSGHTVVNIVWVVFMDTSSCVDLLVLLVLHWYIIVIVYLFTDFTDNC